MISGIGKVVCPNKRRDALLVREARTRRKKERRRERRRLCIYDSPLGDT